MNKLVGALPLCGQRCRRYAIKVLIVVLLLSAIQQYLSFGLELGQWDALLLTGIATFIFGLRVVEDIPQRLMQMLQRLSDSRVLPLREAEQKTFWLRLEERADLWARIIGLLAAFAMVAVFINALAKNYSTQRALLGVAEVIGTYIAGSYLGRFACYGQLGWIFAKNSIALDVNPMHVDGVGGLKPIGNYFFFQAMVVAIPAIFLAVWWYLFPIWPRDYTYWEEAYFGLLGFAILIEILAFVVPLWSFHTIMVKKKAEWVRKADRIAIRITELQAKLEQGTGGSQQALASQIEELSKRYWAIENMATWPLDVKTRRKFEINNILLLVTFAGDFLKRTTEWKQVVDVLKSLMP